MPGEFLTVDESLEVTGWTKATTYTKISRRQIPYLKLGRSIRLRRSDLLKLFREVPALRPLREVEYPVSRENGGKK